MEGDKTGRQSEDGHTEFPSVQLGAITCFNAKRCYLVSPPLPH